MAVIWILIQRESRWNLFLKDANILDMDLNVVPMAPVFEGMEVDESVSCI